MLSGSADGSVLLSSTTAERLIAMLGTRDAHGKQSVGLRSAIQPSNSQVIFFQRCFATALVLLNTLHWRRVLGWAYRQIRASLPWGQAAAFYELGLRLLLMV